MGCSGRSASNRPDIWLLVPGDPCALLMYRFRTDPDFDPPGVYSKVWNRSDGPLRMSKQEVEIWAAASGFGERVFELASRNPWGTVNPDDVYSFPWNISVGVVDSASEGRFEYLLPICL